MAITINNSTPSITYPGVAMRVLKAGGGCSQATVIADIQASAALGAPFRTTVRGGQIMIDPTDKTQAPYTAFKAAMAILCGP
jgi:hypothetical protein